MEKRTKTLAKNTVVLAVGNICTKGIMLILIPFLTRWLSADEYGVFELLTTYTSLFIPLVTLDVGEAAFRFLLDSKCEKENKVIISNVSKIYIIGIILMGFVIGVIMTLYPEVRHFMLPFGLLFLGEALYSYFTLLMRGLKKVEGYALANIVFVLIMTIFAVIYVKILKWQLPGILLAYATGYLASSIFMGIKANLFGQLVFGKFDFHLMKKLLSYSLPLVPNAISWWIVGVSDRTIVSIVLGTSVNAVYAVACKIPNIVQNVFSVFHVSWQQSASETVNDEDKCIYYNKIMNRVFTIFGSLITGVMAVDFILFDYIFGKEYFTGYYLVPILCISIMCSMAANFLGGIYIAQKESRKNGISTVIGAGVNIMVHLLLIYFIGIYAAAISTLVSHIVLFCVRYVDLHKNIKFGIEKKNKIIVLMMLYVFVSIYFHSFIWNCVNLTIVGVFCGCCNSDLIRKCINRLNWRSDD
ncbi:oligosaccharide flippase family protein [Acetatifactor muris]|jgi:O-antigen/teichoic acid export membrane protein|uniref:Polysaccharide biosynthesis protein n=1 Tax=Acetatifactor muris TaxID=879566 RepID=A0A2K4ZMC6_9FIRM|nr:oligosaccharide flippase family protein [Acetatifactor muris]MCI8956315.1 oligosaccharide flippase family protein [Eubacterium sp.]MCR2049856.1 oligosaccharide flippase family protein [Acetatifactor muris]SOY31621.1 Polysaccharide biosynthesis protein [Acetatifactor muris]